MQTVVFGQTISVKADKTSIFIGEQILLKLAVENTQPGIPWFQFADTFNHLEVISRSKIDTVSENGHTNFYQNIAITSFDSGQWQFPALTIAGINQITIPVTIDVLPVDVSKKTDYNEIKEIEEVSSTTNSVIIAILLTIALVSLFMVYYFIQKKTGWPAGKPILNENETPLEWALRQLEVLKDPAQQSLAENKFYYAELNRISRTYFSMQLLQNNLPLTSDEWMIVLSRLHIDSDHKTAFFQFLRLADSVRFAKYIPPSSENEKALNAVKVMLQKTSFLHSKLYSKYQPQKY